MGKLAYFRRLPRMLRILSVLGILLLLAAMAMMSVVLLTGITILRMLPNESQMAPPADPMLRLVIAGMALAMIGAACAWPTNMYMARLRHPNRAVAPRLATWQEQVAAALALAALPLCSLAVTLLLPFLSTNMLFTGLLFLTMAALTVIEAFLLFAANIWTFTVALG